MARAAAAAPAPAAAAKPCLRRTGQVEALKGGALRIDRYLHCIRLAKSRTLAQALVEQGHARIDGRRVTKPSEPVRVGSTLALPLRGQVRVIRVLALPARRGPPAEARLAYEEIDESGTQT